MFQPICVVDAFTDTKAAWLGRARGDRVLVLLESAQAVRALAPDHRALRALPCPG
jgi:hypothetical protein